MLREDRLQDRAFQRHLAQEALAANSLLVLPTGLGKTVIAAAVIAAVLEKVGGRALVLAPSKPLADQHRTTFARFLDAGPVACLTGSEGPRRRSTLWRTRRVITATPQTAVNDASRGLLPKDFSIVVFDEAHRAVGDYAYVAFAAWLREHCPGALVLGLTASPGHEMAHIEEVQRNLGIRQVLIRSREDADVAPYVAPMLVRRVEVEVSEVIEKATAHLTKFLHARYNKLRRYGLLRNRKNTQVRMADLGQVGAQLAARMAKEGRKPVLFQAFRQLSLARMAMHAANTVQREGVDALRRFMAPKLRPSRKRIDASFVNDLDVARALKVTAKWKGPSHPKLLPLVALLKERALPGRKIIVFAELRDTVDFLVDLFRAEGLTAERFTGQGTREGRKGMTQTQQRATLQRFAAAEFPILVATSIAEEGLDIPQVDLVVFYEPVASDIRIIQRSGRTARDAPGEVVILTTDRSLDEKYLWSGVRREKKMRRLVGKLAAEGVGRLKERVPVPSAVQAPDLGAKGQATLDGFG